MKQVRVFSRQVFNEYCREKNWDVVDNFNIFDTDVAVIEILDSADGINFKPFFEKGSDRVLIQRFDDVAGEIDDCIVFSKTHADNIVKFICARGTSDSL